MSNSRNDANGQSDKESVIKLGQAITIVSGAPFKSELFNDVGNGLPLIRVRDVNTGPAGIFYSGEYLKEHLVTNGDLLVSMDGDFKAVRWSYGDGLLNQRVCKIIPKDDVLHRHYLEQFLPKALSDIHRETTFTTIKHLSTKTIREIEIPLPPLDDQKRIAHLLGKVEGLIAQRKQHLQQLDDLLKSVFLEMFGDPITNPRRFPVRKLSEFYINPKEGTKCGPFGSALKKDELVDSGIPVWNMDNIDPSGRMILPFRMWITKEKYKDLASYSVIDGDIIISRAGTVGKMCVARMDGEPAIISTNLIRLRLGDKLRPLHVVSLMTYCKGRVGRLKTGADGAFTHMNTGILDKLEFPYPPTDLQDQFAAVVEKVEGLKSRYQQSLADLETLYGALSQKAFKGELDLSRVPSPDGQPDNVVVTPAPASAGASTSMGAVTISWPRETITNLTEGIEPFVEYPLSKPESREIVLRNAFQYFLQSHTPGREFSLPSFWEQLSWNTQDYVGEDDLPFNVKDYDLIKTLTFEALERGKLEQTCNEIKPGDQIELGNQIILKKVK